MRLHIESPQEDAIQSVSRPLYIRGWAFSPSSTIKRVEVSLGDRSLGEVRYGIKRPDVVEAFPEQTSEKCGFEQYLVIDGAASGPHELRVTIHDKEGNRKTLSQQIHLAPLSLPNGNTKRGRRFSRNARASKEAVFDRVLKTRAPLPGSSPTVEFRIPISATDQFLRMLHYFLESVQLYGGPLARSAHCVVSVSRDQPVRDLAKECPWSNKYSVEFQWLEDEYFNRFEYHGTGMHRFHITSEADVVMLLDVDLIMAGDLDSIILQAYHSQRVLGFPAHVSPFARHHAIKSIPSERWWNWIFDEAGLPQPTLDSTPTAWDTLCRDEKHKPCPGNYFNCGVMIGPRHLIERLGETFEEELTSIDQILETDFKSQIANVMVMARHNIPWGLLPLNCNFALNVSGEDLRRLNPDPQGKNRPEDVCIFHYLASGEVNKRHFATTHSLEGFLGRDDLSPDATELQKKLIEIHNRLSS